MIASINRSPRWMRYVHCQNLPHVFYLVNHIFLTRFAELSHPRAPSAQPLSAIVVVAVQDCGQARAVEERN